MTANNNVPAAAVIGGQQRPGASGGASTADGVPFPPVRASSVPRTSGSRRDGSGRPGAPTSWAGRDSTSIPKS